MGSSDELVDLAKELTGRIAAGIAVMTLVDGAGVKRGMTISSLTPVSADPPSVLMCIGGTASSRPALTVGRAFCANLLAADQTPVSAGFAWGDEDPFDVFEWEPAADGTPVLAGIAAHLMCRVEKVVEHHDTAVVLAAVESGAAHKDEALVYWRRSYFGDLVPVQPEAGGVW